MKRSLSLNIEPLWEEIEKVREKTAAFLGSHDFSRDSVYAVTMVVSELIENGMKYGNFAPQQDKVRLDISLSGKTLTVEVTNPVDESAYGHLKRLDKAIQWIRGYQDPFEAYMEKLKEVSRRPIGDEESGLGLVRIAYEGRAILDFFVNETGQLNVSAVLKQ